MGAYFIKDDYEHRTTNATVEEHVGDYWTPTRLLLSRHVQHAVYALAADVVRQHRLKTVLDVGCGLGHKLDELLAPLASVTGVDQPTALEQSRRLFPRIRFEPADLERPHDTGLGTFDLVMSADVIEHLLDPDMLLTFMEQHLAPGGRLIVSTPERDARRGPGNRRSPKPEHVREWNRPELAAYLGSRGWSIERHVMLPAFRVPLGSAYMLKERFRLLKKRVPLAYTQAVVATRPTAR